MQTTGATSRCQTSRQGIRCSSSMPSPSSVCPSTPSCWCAPCPRNPSASAGCDATRPPVVAEGSGSHTPARLCRFNSGAHSTLGRCTTCTWMPPCASSSLTWCAPRQRHLRDIRGLCVLSPQRGTSQHMCAGDIRGNRMPTLHRDCCALLLPEQTHLHDQLFGLQAPRCVRFPAHLPCSFVARNTMVPLEVCRLLETLQDK